MRELGYDPGRCISRNPVMSAETRLQLGMVRPGFPAGAGLQESSKCVSRKVALVMPCRFPLVIAEWTVHPIVP